MWLSVVCLLVTSCRAWFCAVHCSPAAAVAAAVVSAVGSVNHLTMMKTTSMSTLKTWRPKSKQSRTEVRDSGHTNMFIIFAYLTYFLYRLMFSPGFVCFL